EDGPGKVRAEGDRSPAAGPTRAAAASRGGLRASSARRVRRCGRPQDGGPTGEQARKGRKGMCWWLRRWLVSVLLLWMVVTIVFFAIYLVPGEPAELLLSGGDGGAASAEAVAALRTKLGLDLPLWQQYLNKL